MNSNLITIEDLIRVLQLQPLPDEGGLFSQSYCSVESIPADGLPPRYAGKPRPFGTAIYYLLTSAADSFSALHRLLTDEVFHFYLGDPLEGLLLYPDGASRTVTLGQDILAGEQIQFVVPAGIWQGWRVKAGGKVALIGTTMAPGYTQADFELGKREILTAQYPGSAKQIRRLTR